MSDEYRWRVSEMDYEAQRAEIKRVALRVLNLSAGIGSPTLTAILTALHIGAEAALDGLRQLDQDEKVRAMKLAERNAWIIAENKRAELAAEESET